MRRPKWKRVPGMGRRVYEDWHLGVWKIVFRSGRVRYYLAGHLGGSNTEDEFLQALEHQIPRRYVTPHTPMSKLLEPPYDRQYWQSVRVVERIRYGKKKDRSPAMRCIIQDEHERDRRIGLEYHSHDS